MSVAVESAVVELRGVSKQFPGVLAVEDVSLEIRAGEVHVVCGENGAGKSTLMKLLSQVERPSAGEILISGEPADFHGPRHAQQLGIAMVYQEFALAPHLSVFENLFLGREPGRFTLNRGREIRAARTLLERVGLDLSPNRLISTLSVAEQQRVEIAKALAIEAKLVILDEPTAALTQREIEELFGVIEDLKRDGIAVLYISHRLEEIFRVADRITVMRDGHVVDTVERGEVDEDGLIRLMVGRDIENLYPKPTLERDEAMLRVEGITRPGILEDCSFEVHAHEILGFAGLVGAGRSELARAIFGADPITGGRIELDGEEVTIASPAEAIKRGVGYLTEDRKGDGLAMLLGVDQNITLARLPLRAGALA